MLSLLAPSRVLCPDPDLIGDAKICWYVSQLFSPNDGCAIPQCTQAGVSTYGDSVREAEVVRSTLVQGISRYANECRKSRSLALYHISYCRPALLHSLLHM